MANETTKPEDIKTASVNQKPPETKAAPDNQPPLDIKKDTTINNLVSLNDTQKGQENQAKSEIKQPVEAKPETKIHVVQGKDKMPPEANKPSQTKEPDKKPAPPKDPQSKQGGNVGSTSAKSTDKTPPPATKTEQPKPEPEPPKPTKAPRSNDKEKIVYLNLSELHPFKNHPFQVRQDAEMAAMVESVKDKGVTQPAIVRPREDGGYELVSGHRRQLASEMAGYTNMPCIVRNLTDEQAITQMVEDNTNQRENILPSERAAALKMQLDAIKRQGVRDDNGTKGQRSNEIVAERNGMTVKQVQRYIKLNDLTPDLMKMVDEKKVAFTPAVEFAFIKPKNQNYIAVAIEGNQSSPSLSQAQRLRDLDQKNLLNPDMIDGIMMEEKKEVDKVILSSKELAPFFGANKTPREMKDTILKLLEENKAKNPPEVTKAEVKPQER